MNSLNILSGRVSPPQTPGPSRSNSHGNILSSGTTTTTTTTNIEARKGSREDSLSANKEDTDDAQDHEIMEDGPEAADEKTALLENEKSHLPEEDATGWLAIPKRISLVLIDSLRLLLSAVAAPGIYLITFLYDEEGNFRPFSSMRRGPNHLSTAQTLGLSSEASSTSEQNNRNSGLTGRRASIRGTKLVTSNSSSSGLSSGSESERDRSRSGTLVTSRNTRANPSYRVDEISPARRSIRIKLHNEDNVRQRKNRNSQSMSSQSNGSGAISGSEISAANLKSPTSPASALLMTKYPRAPAPPRPLIPRRQPSYTILENPSGTHTQKTLILDLDETLIHSMAKGGRMGTGHMVEVKLNTVVGAGNTATLGPQHPILYYVHKRPHCDDFLRRVCKWYNLVIFTASVQEYADPVIDWLEQERKFFSGRYYRQHCTYRQGAFIKDLSSVEPDLSKVMILDNSPLSYMFHQDNAIPIEGWINDPTDNDLLHLVPLLEGLQYVTDVRAFLALRGGEEKHIA